MKYSTTRKPTLNVERLECRRLLTTTLFHPDDAGPVVSDLPGDVGGFDVAFNAVDNEFLVVWSAVDTSVAGIVLNEHEVFGQLISGTDGIRLGEKFRISEAGGTGDDSFDAVKPQVAWSARDNQYLVVWEATFDDDGDDTNVEIMGQIVGANAQTVVDDFRISLLADEPVERDAFNPAVAYNGITDDFLVAWNADDRDAPTGDTIYAQRVGGAGEQLGDELRLSQGLESNTPAIATSSRGGEYLVSWLSLDGIFAQVVNSDGTVAAGDDISVAPREPSDEFFGPDVVYQSSTDQFVVAWSGLGGPRDFLASRAVSPEGVQADHRELIVFPDPLSEVRFGRPKAVYNSREDELFLSLDVSGPVMPGMIAREQEVFGVRVGADDEVLSPGLTRLTETGLPGDNRFDATFPVVALSPQTNQYFMVWNTNDRNLSAPGNFFPRRKLLQVADVEPIDILPHANADVIVNTNGNQLDRVQDGNVFDEVVLVTDSAASRLDPNGNGLPDDGVFSANALHPKIRLDYPRAGDGNSAIVVPAGGEVRIPVPPQFYPELHLFASAHSSTEMDVDVFQTGGVITVCRPNIEVPSASTPIADTRNRYTLISDMDFAGIEGDLLLDSNKASIFGFRIESDANALVTEITVRNTGTPPLVIFGLAGVGPDTGEVIVDSLADDRLFDYRAGDVSLREAVGIAEASPVDRSVRFADDLAGGTVLLEREQGPMLIRAASDNPTAPIRQVTIVGPSGGSAIIDGQQATSIFHNVPNSALVLENLQLVNGRARSRGGAIDNGGDLTLRNVSIRNSVAHTFSGGAIFHQIGQLLIERSAFTGNSANEGGGALSITGRAEVVDSVFRGNRADFSVGGAIKLAENSVLDIIGSELSGNSAHEGGAIQSAGSVDVINSTLSGNSSQARGGAAFASGIFNTFNATITDNQSNALAAFGGAALVTVDEFFKLLLVNSIVTDNRGGTTIADLFVASDVNGPVRETSRHNLIGVAAGLTGVADGTNENRIGTRQLPVDPKIGPLQDNGGPTRTHALRPGSLAIDHGTEETSRLRTTDQRGAPFRRIVGETIDVGAFERQAERNRADVDGDGVVSPLDALRVINHLTNPGGGPANGSPLDVDEDGFVSPLDALIVINQLSRTSSSAVTAPMAMVSDELFAGSEGDESDPELRVLDDLFSVGLPTFYGAASGGSEGR